VAVTVINPSPVSVRTLLESILAGPFTERMTGLGDVEVGGVILNGETVFQDESILSMGGNWESTCVDCFTVTVVVTPVAGAYDASPGCEAAMVRTPVPFGVTVLLLMLPPDRTESWTGRPESETGAVTWKGIP
jgi:hypothetical protein